MAVATLNSRRETVSGDGLLIIADVTWGNADTYDSLHKNAVEAWFAPTTSASWGLTLSAGVVTFASGGALTGKLFILTSGQ
jgi:hypothetical protein